jgi:hypothetical protein
MTEIWKNIIVNGEETIYSVSNLGRLSNGKKIMSNRVKGNKYVSITLRVNKKGFGTRMHRLVAFYFVDNPNNLPQVNHKDGVKYHNAASNLEWCTPKQNIIHSFELGLVVRPKGKESHLYDKGTRILHEPTGKIYPSIPTAAREFKIPRTTISAEIHGYRPNKYGFIKL